MYLFGVRRFENWVKTRIVPRKRKSISYCKDRNRSNKASHFTEQRFDSGYHNIRTFGLQRHGSCVEGDKARNCALWHSLDSSPNPFASSQRCCINLTHFWRNREKLKSNVTFLHKLRIARKATSVFLENLFPKGEKKKFMCLSIPSLQRHRFDRKKDQNSARVPGIKRPKFVPYFFSLSL